MRRWIIVFAALLGAAMPAIAGEADAAADGVEGRLEQLERQNREILERLRASEARNEELERRLGEPAPAPDVDPGMLEGAIADYLAKNGSGAPFADLTKSGKPLRFYGFFRLDAYWDSGRMNSIIVPFWAKSDDEEGNDEVLALDARLTRIGLEVHGGRIGDADVTAKLETDFANFVSGGAESRPFLRIRVAWLDLDFGDFALRAGQDWDVISPLYPTPNGEGVMWNSGNLGDRRPQVELRTKGGDPEGTQWDGVLAAGLTGAIDNLDLDDNGERDGFDYGAPGLLARVGVKTPSWVDGEKISAGVWGHYAGLETAMKVGGEDSFTAWSLGLDFVVPLGGGLVIRGEAWTGQALSDVRGGIGQSVNTDTGEEIGSTGGWVELGVKASDSLFLAFGASADDPDNADLMSGARAANRAIYGSGRVDWGGGLSTGVDVIWWKTKYVGIADGDVLRFDVYMKLDW